MSSTPTHGSDTQIPGWWIASDGRWYPPETHPNYVPPAPPPPVQPAAPAVETPAYTAPVADVPTPDMATPSYTAPEVATPGVYVNEMSTPDYTTPSAAGAVAGAAGDVTGTLGDAASGVTGGLGDAASGVTGKLGDAAGGMTGKLGDVAGGLGDKLGGGASASGAAMVAGAAGVGAGASGLMDKAKDALPDMPDMPDVSAPTISTPDYAAPDHAAPDHAAPNHAAPNYDAVNLGEAVPVIDPEPATIVVSRDEAVSAIQEPVEVVTPPMPEITQVQTPVVEAPEVLAAPAPVVAHATAPAPIPGTHAAAQPVVTSAPIAPTYTTPAEPAYTAPDPIIQMDKPKRRSVFAGLLALAAGALAIVGSLMQWANGTAETAGNVLYDIDVPGMESNGLGALIAGIVLCVIALFLLFGIGKQSFWGVLAFIAGAVIVGLAVFSFVDITGLDESHADALRGDTRLQNGALKVVVNSAIGLWLTTAGGILGVLAAPFVNRK